MAFARRASFIVALVAAVGCSTPDTENGAAPAAGSSSGSVAPTEGTPPSGAKASPEVELVDLEGAPVSLRALRGDVAIVNFWGTWCLPCRTELPELVDLAQAYADRGVRVVGIAVDSGTPEEIRAFAREYGVDYELWVTTMDTALSEFGAIGYPFTLLIDREGWIRKEYLGPQTQETLAEGIDSLLD